MREKHVGTNYLFPAYHNHSNNILLVIKYGFESTGILFLLPPEFNMVRMSGVSVCVTVHTVFIIYFFYFIPYALLAFFPDRMMEVLIGHRIVVGKLAAPLFVVMIVMIMVVIVIFFAPAPMLYTIHGYFHASSMRRDKHIIFDNPILLAAFYNFSGHDEDCIPRLIS